LKSKAKTASHIALPVLSSVLENFPQAMWRFVLALGAISAALGSTVQDGTLKSARGREMRKNFSEIPSSFSKPEEEERRFLINNLGDEELMKVFTANKPTISALQGMLGRRSTETRITAYGGSITAGARVINPANRYHAKFRKRLARKLKRHPSSFPVFNAGHSSRNSFYGTMFYGTQVPLDTDILLWEYSVNDDNLRLDGDELAVQYVFEQFFSRVAKLDKPPIVAIIYLYRGRITNKLDRFEQFCFEATNELAKKYSFVLGYVNLASALNSSSRGYKKTLKRYVSGDRTHPKRRAHNLISKLLVRLFDSALNEKVVELDEQDSSKIEGVVVLPPWPCGSKGSKLKELLRRRDASFFSWNAELPKVGDVQVQLDLGSFEWKELKYGRTHHYRDDRKLAVDLPCCDDGYARLLVDRNIAGFHLYVDHENEVQVKADVGLERIDADEWNQKCFLNTYDGFNLWFIPKLTLAFINQVQLCKTKCDRNNGLHWASFLIVEN